VFLATGICLVASTKFGNPLNWTGPNLSGRQLIVSTWQSPGGGTISQLSSAQAARLGGQVDSLAASLHARPVPLESAGATLYQVGTPQNSPSNFTGNVYVATPQLLATYGIKASQIAPGADIVTMRPGLAGEPHMEMIWPQPGYQYPGKGEPGSSGSPPCTLSNDCLASPAIQTAASLPGGTSAPNTVITQYAVSRYHLPTQLSAWLVQAPAPLTATQVSAARQLALAYGVTVETKSGNPDLGEFANGATALGIVISFCVLAASVGLIRSEAARDLRTLTATGASGATRRTITAATAAALGLLGAILGLAGALVTGLAWAHGSLSATFGDLPLTDVLILLAGLPLAAAAVGWLLAGREPAAISRQPLD
jgi:putative ABC transport system permease protein